jgi:MoxR-like ATPase
MHTLVLPWIQAATKHFVFAERMRTVMSLAVASREFSIFNGAGGHGKSEFLMAALAAIKDVTPFVKSLGQGTTTEELFGGIDFDALNRDTGACIQYKPELSFLAHRVVILEEMFDAPGRVLNALKDTLTAKKLRNGAQEYDMQTVLMFVATNHDPADIAAAGADNEALTQRYPLQLKVAWPSYDSDAFLEMFLTTDDVTPETDLVTWADVVELQEQTANVKINKHIKQIVAKVIEELISLDASISPRTAMKALSLIRAAAAINGRDHAIPDDIRVIEYLPGCEAHKAKIIQFIEEYANEFNGADTLELIEQRLREIDVLVGLMPVGTPWAKLHSEMLGLQKHLQAMVPSPVEKTRHEVAFELSKRLYDDLKDLKNGRYPSSRNGSGAYTTPASIPPLIPAPLPVPPPMPSPAAVPVSVGAAYAPPQGLVDVDKLKQRFNAEVQK